MKFCSLSNSKTASLQIQSLLNKISLQSIESEDEYVCAEVHPKNSALFPFLKHGLAVGLKFDFWIGANAEF